jgi:hypothetical protein
VYASSTSALATGSNLKFDGSNLGVGMTPVYVLDVTGGNGNAIRFNDSSNSVQVAMGAYNSTGFFGTLNNFPQLFYANGGEKMRLTSAGYLGIGTSSPPQLLSVQGSSNPAINVRNTSSTIDANFYVTSTETTIGNSNSYPFTFTTNNTERMRIDSSGNVLVNSATLPTALNTNIRSVYVKGSSNGVVVASSSDGASSVTLYSGQSSSDNPAIAFQNSLRFATATDVGIGGFSERMRIDSSGNVLVGKTSASLTSGNGFMAYPDGTTSMVTSNSTNSWATLNLYSTGASAYRFYVGGGGTVYATSTTITAISDQRLKENIRDLDEGLATVLALKPRKFDWKEGKGANIKNARGFIAQEFETVLPDMIEEWRDPAPQGEEPYKAINANLIPTLVKAIQELSAELNALKAKVG